MLADRIQRIGFSPTLKISAKATAMKAEGVDVLDLSVGEPDFPTPENIRQAAKRAIDQNFTKYTANDGILPLRQAICKKLKEDNGLEYEPDEIIVSTGAKQSVYNVLLTLVNPQDEVIILAPYWVSYPEMVKLVYGVPVVVTPEDGGFHPRMQEIEAAVSTYTKAIIVNSPNNPSGLVFSEAFIGEVVEFCERRGIYLIMDDIYHQLVFDGAHAASAYRFTKVDLEDSRLLVVNGVSKLYGMTGFRIGWVVGPRHLVEVMTNLQGQITSNPSAISQAAAEGALTGGQGLVESLRLTIQNNRDVMMRELQGLTDLRTVCPQGTFYCLPDFSAYNRKSLELANFLLQKALVVTVPGSEFGAEGHLRLSFAGTVKDVKQGVERIKWALDPSAPSEIYIGDRRMVRDWL